MLIAFFNLLYLDDANTGSSIKQYSIAADAKSVFMPVIFQTLYRLAIRKINQRINGVNNALSVQGILELKKLFARFRFPVDAVNYLYSISLNITFVNL